MKLIFGDITGRLSDGGGGVLVDIIHCGAWLGLLQDAQQEEQERALAGLAVMVMFQR